MIKKVIKIILVLICMITIFTFSSDSSYESTKKSNKLIITFAEMFNRKELSKKDKARYIEKFVVVVRKGAHLSIYLVLGLLVASLLKEYNIVDKRMIIYGVLSCFLYACSDEIHQLFVPGRSGEILDVLIDTIGSFIGISLYYLIGRRRNEQEKAIR